MPRRSRGCADAALYTPDVVTTTARSDASGVPDISAAWYQDIVAFAARTPEWVQTMFTVLTDGGVIVLLLLVLVAAWRARGRSAENMALVVLTPVAAALAYGINRIAKALIEEPRPCRVLDVDPVGGCPPADDWSFPSNHAVVAAAFAVGLLLTWRWLGAVALLLAVGIGYSRIFLGAHYPHDIVVGALVGAAVVLVLALLLSNPTATLVRRLRQHRGAAVLLGAEPRKPRESRHTGTNDAPTEVFRAASDPQQHAPE